MQEDAGDRFEADARVPEELPLEPDTQVVVRGGGRGRLLLAAVVAVASIGAGVAVLVRTNEDADGGKDLRAAQEFVEGVDGYRFEQLSKTHVVIGDPDGAGTDTTTRSLVTGVVAAEDRWHLVEDHGSEFGDEMEAYETIRVDDQIYSSGMMDPGMEGPGWIVMPVPDEMPTADDLSTLYEDMELGGDDPYADEMRLDLAIQSYLSNGAGDPTVLTRVVTEATEPAVEEQRGDGGVVLRVQLPPAPELAALGDIPTVETMLVLDADRRPMEARFTAEAGTASADVTVTFEWDGDLTVEPPPDADVDHTPWISEEALAAVDPALLLVPTSVPEPLELVGASVMDGSYEMGTSEGDESAATCSEVSLTFGSEADLRLAEDEATMSEEELTELYENMTYLDISIADPACSDMYDVASYDDELGGLPASGDFGGWEVAVRDMVVTIYSEGHDDEQLGALVASMQPTTADALIAAIPPWVAEAMAEGPGYFGFPMTGMMGPMGFG